MIHHISMFQQRVSTATSSMPLSPLARGASSWWVLLFILAWLVCFFFFIFFPIYNLDFVYCVMGRTQQKGRTRRWEGVGSMRRKGTVYGCTLLSLVHHSTPLENEKIERKGEQRTRELKVARWVRVPNEIPLRVWTVSSLKIYKQNKICTICTTLHLHHRLH